MSIYMCPKLVIMTLSQSHSIPMLYLLWGFLLCACSSTDRGDLDTGPSKGF